jgi:uncharacterized protein (DUF1501 family)
MASYRTCDGVRRRDFLKVGALASLGLSLPNYLRLARAGEVAEKGAKAAIFVNLGGGPSHLDMFDMKPAAPAEFRGEFNPIATNVPGVEICEHLPRLAQCADKFAILRGVSHTLAAHEVGTQYMTTGNRPIPSLEFPGYGAVVNKELKARDDLPSFVAIPTTPQRAGYLGVQYAALQTNSTPTPKKPYTVRGLSLAKGLTISDVEKREQLLNDLDNAFKDMSDAYDLVGGLDEFSERAYDMITSPRAREAFDIGKEDPSVVERFGEHAFGQSCLLACRLIEAGVRFATVTIGGFDTHNKNFESLKGGKLKNLDEALSAMFARLADKGLLDSTSICVTGEFGRTPKINPRAGRDHWPRAMFVLLGGGGMKGGQVIGESDDKGMGPAHEPITPEQVAASFYHSLGIDYAKEYHTATGRPVKIVREGSLIPQLF